MTDQPYLPPLRKRLARVLKTLIKDLGLTLKDTSLATGKSGDVLGKILRGDQRFPLEYFETLCQCLQVSPDEVLRKAMPSANDVHSAQVELDPRVLLMTLADSEEIKSARLRRLVCYSPPSVMALGDAEPLAMGRLLQIEDTVFDSVDRAVQQAFFQLETLQDEPDSPQQYAACLGLLGALLRSVRTPRLSEAAWIVVRAFEIADAYPSLPLTAYLFDKASRLVWSMGRQKLAIRMLQSDRLLHHPQPDHLFALRGAYYFWDGDFDLSRACMGIALKTTTSNVVKASVADFTAQIYGRRGERTAALRALDDVEELSLNEGIEQRLSWTRGRVLRDTGNHAGAADIFARLFCRSTISRNPQLRGYLLYDLVEVAGTGMLESMRSEISACLGGLELANSIEEALHREIIGLLEKRHPTIDPRHGDRRGVVSRTI